MAFHESENERLARLEEGLVGLRGELRTYHTTLSEVVKPMREKVEGHTVSLAVLRRDRWWLFTLAGSAFTAGLFAMFHAG